MFKNILLVTDQERHSLSILEHAIPFAKVNQANIQLLFIIPSRDLQVGVPTLANGKIIHFPNRTSDYARKRKKDGEKILSQFASQCQNAGVNSSIMLRAGYPGNAIPYYASFADLAIVQRRSKPLSFSQRIFETPWRVISRKSKCPLMLVSEKYVKPDNILVIYDGRLHSNSNLRLAASLAQTLNLRLTLMAFPSRQSDGFSDDKQLQSFLSGFGLKMDTITMRSRKRDSLFEKLEGKPNSLLAISAYRSGLAWTSGGWLHSRITSSSIPVLVVP